MIKTGYPLWWMALLMFGKLVEGKSKSCTRSEEDCCPVSCICEYQNTKPPIHMVWNVQCKASNIQQVPSLGNPALWTTLHLRSNQIRTLTQFCFGAIRYYSIDISQNRISKIDKFAFEKTEIFHLLNMSTNQIESIIPNTFRGLETLQNLRLDNNEMTSFPSGALDGLFDLRNLTMTANSLRTISPPAFDDLRKLNNLDLSRNQLTSIPRLRNNLELRVLNLSHNRITMVRKTDLIRLKHLVTLDLSNNRIKQIESRSIHFCEGLTVLRLENNCLTSLHSDIFPVFMDEFGDDVRVSGNPLDLEKSAYWLRRRVPDQRQLYKRKQCVLSDKLLNPKNHENDSQTKSRRSHQRKTDGNRADGLSSTPHHINLVIIICLSVSCCSSFFKLQT